jgi:hypothetical protein
MFLGIISSLIESDNTKFFGSPFSFKSLIVELKGASTTLFVSQFFWKDF